MLPNGIAGVEFHHEHRVLYKSLPEHHDYLYKWIFSDGRLNRIVRPEFFCRQSVMSFVDRWEQLLAEAGRWDKGSTCKIKNRPMWKSLPLIAPILGRLVRYAPFIVVLFHRPWRRIWSTFAHALPAIRVGEPQLMCVFLLYLISGEERALFPMRKVRPFLCLAGRFYLYFELSPSYARVSSQGLSPAISVLIVCKIQHTQISFVPVVLSVAFPLFMGDGPSFFWKSDVWQSRYLFCFSGLEDARDTLCSCEQSSKDKAVKS
jgi:hypothetical protein